MHFELPEKINGSLKEFASQYVMIVVSILTALALEQLVLTVHHGNAARHASEDIRAELRENARGIDKVRKTHAANLASVQATMDQIVAEIRKNEPPGEDRLTELGRAALQISVNNPAVLTNAWEAAIADQSVIYMDQKELKRYAAVYTNMRSITDLSGHLLTDNLLRDLADLRLEVKTGKVNLQDAARTLSRTLMTMTILGSHLEQLDDLLKEFNTKDGGH